MNNFKTSIALLWDIDGTLLGGGLGAVTAWRLAARAELGTADLDWGSLDTRGATDLFIAAQICAHCGKSATAATSLINRYLQELPNQLAEQPSIPLTNVEALLRYVDNHPRYVNLLLTGNLRAAAHLKLASSGLSDFRWEGGFGESGLERDQVAHAAKRTAIAQCGGPVPMLVLGDTPRDITAARAIGAQVIGVATGSYESKELALHNPDHLFSHLPAPEVFAKTVEGLFATPF